MGLRDISVLVSLSLSLSLAAEVLEEAELSCPHGFSLFEGDLGRGGVAAPAGLSRLVPAQDEDACFQRCEVDESCLSVTYDEAAGECVMEWVIGATLDTLCRAAKARRDGVPWERLTTLACRDGCTRLRKICQSCSSQSLRAVLEAAFCSGRLFGEETPRGVCAGSAVESPPGASGQDEHRFCCLWAAQGECEANPFFMKIHCSNACGTQDCRVKSARSCKVRVRKECRSPSASLISSKAAEVEDPDDPNCPDRHPLCSFWAFQGECSKNHVYMRRNCKRSCRLC